MLYYNDKIKEASTIEYIYNTVEGMGGGNDRVFQEIAALAIKITGGESCFLALFDEEKDIFLLKAVEGSTSHNSCQNQMSSPANAPLKEVIRKKETVLINSNGSSSICAPLMIRNKAFGVLNVRCKINNKQFTRSDLYYIRSLSSRASLNIENNILYESLYTNITDTFKSLITSIQLRDHYTEIHSCHVADLAGKTAQALHCSENQIQSLKIAALLHDIGKIAIPDRILLKESRLTDEEYTIIKSHPMIGENILKQIVLMEFERDIISHHHERWDGTGYPDRLWGENIPFLSRILSVADSFDAMTTDRPYRKALTKDIAIGELRKNCNRQFDQKIVDAFTSAAI